MTNIFSSFYDFTLNNENANQNIIFFSNIFVRFYSVSTPHHMRKILKNVHVEVGFLNVFSGSKTTFCQRFQESKLLLYSFSRGIVDLLEALEESKLLRRSKQNVHKNPLNNQPASTQKVLYFLHCK